MRKVHIVGKSCEKIEDLKNQLEQLGLEFCENNPDLVISYGGDGMFLISERMFPHVPKILIRDSAVCNHCCNLGLKEIIKKYLNRDYEVMELKKIKAEKKGFYEKRELIGVNDIVIRNSLPTEAIRFKIKINGFQVEGGKEFIGDGLVIATAYGSNKGAYFYSITRKTFEKGIGIAFNNTVESQKEIFISESDKLEVEITRGPGVLVADNNRDFVNLEKGDKVFINEIEDFARKIVLKN